jgi:hypothetical protein
MNVITVSTLALGITLTSALPADNPNSEVSVLKCGSIRVKDDTLPFKIIPLNASSLGDCHIVNSKPISFTVKKGCGCYLHQYVVNLVLGII